MVSRSTRPPGLTQISGTSRVEQALKAVIEFLQPFAQPSRWQEIPYYGDYTNTAATGYLPAGFRKDAMGRVWLRGGCASVSGGGTIGTLPEGYRPSAIATFNVLTDTGVGVLLVDSGGVMYKDSGGTVLFSLDGVSFDTEA